MEGSPVWVSFVGNAQIKSSDLPDILRTHFFFVLTKQEKLPSWCHFFILVFIMREDESIIS